MEELNEVMSVAQRKIASRTAKRTAKKRARTKKKKELKKKGSEDIHKTAVRMARQKMVDKILKGRSLADMNPAAKVQLSKRLEKPTIKRKIEKMAKKLERQVRKQEPERIKAVKAARASKKESIRELRKTLDDIHS